jgi:hypothetical protein
LSPSSWLRNWHETQLALSLAQHTARENNNSPAINDVVRSFAHDEVAAAKVRCDNFVEIVDVALLNWGERHDPCAVHDNRNFPKRRLCLIKKLRNFGSFGDICANRSCLAPGNLDALDCFLCLRTVSRIVHNN